MPTKCLTNAAVKSLVPMGKRYDVRDSGQNSIHGLFVRVESSGKKTFYLDYVFDGKRNTRKIGDATILTVAEARSIARLHLAEIAMGRNPFEKSAGELTLRRFIDTCYKTVVETTQKNLQTINNLFAHFPDFLDVPMDDVTIEMIIAWQQEELTNNKGSSANRKLNSLRGAFRWAYKNKLIRNNALFNAENLPETDSRNCIRYLTDEELKRLMNVLDERERKKNRVGKDFLKPIVILSLNTGIRKGAMMSLQWSDIDFTARTIFLRADAAKNSKPKYLPMNTTVYKTLMKWKQACEENNVQSPYIFSSPRTGGKRHDCDNPFERILKQAGIEGFRWHDLRHSFASHLVQHGEQIEVVSDLMCHSSIKTTQKYAHLTPQMSAKAVQTLDDMYKDE